ncbi:hypothetical protein [Chryseobacterium indoltheticum]|uniref:hypothetical protein n=1 Tax=Chryseobacterium indoltheticum TaxID=254 RepID=UPI003F492555
MNIDDLKNAWNDDVSDETPEISIEQKNKINLPARKIRKNMRMEFLVNGRSINFRIFSRLDSYSGSSV